VGHGLVEPEALSKHLAAYVKAQWHDDRQRVEQRRNGDVMTEQPKSGFFDDDGTEINPDLITKPSLCVSCRKDDDRNEEILCTLTRADQQGEDDFQCFAFEPKP
jgi:hypothetical protein